MDEVTRLNPLNFLEDDKKSFKKLGIPYEEKVFFDILVSVRDAHNFYRWWSTKIISKVSIQNTTFNIGCDMIKLSINILRRCICGKIYQRSCK